MARKQRTTKELGFGFHPVSSQAGDTPMEGVVSNSLLLALRGAAGPMLTCYQLGTRCMPAIGEVGLPSWVPGASGTDGASMQLRDLTVVDSCDATTMLLDFRAVQWSFVCEVWARAGKEMPDLGLRALDLFRADAQGRCPERVIEYLGIAAGERVATLEARGESAKTEAYRWVMALCTTQDLMVAARTAASDALFAGMTDGAMGQEAIEAWQETCLAELSPIPVLAAAAPNATGKARLPRAA
ncbi:MAG: hypothetical protein ACYCZN_01185 [Candidatus Dormibacteria bacterium]